MSLEFVYASEGYDEFVALCANPAVIENRVDRLRHHQMRNDRVQDQLTSHPRSNHHKYRVYASFEILLLQDPAATRIEKGLQDFPGAIFALCRQSTFNELTELARLLVQHGVQIHHTRTGSQSISFICRYRNCDYVQLMRTLVRHDGLSTHVCDTLVRLCRNGGADNLIDRVRALTKFGIDVVRLDCDSADSINVITEDVENIFSKLDDDVVEEEESLLESRLGSILKSCRTTIHLKIHSHQGRIIYNHQIDHAEESGLLSFNTRENSIYLPAYREWQNIHAAWHRPPEVVANTGPLGQWIFKYLDEHSHRREVCDKSPNRCDWCGVGAHVDDYLNRLMDKVEEMCSLFAVKRFVRYGSSAEKTNIFRASEFDRGVVLLNFGQSPSDPNQIVYTGSDPNYLALKLDGEPSNKPINSSTLIGLLMKFTTEAVERVHSVHVFAPTVAFGETCVTVYFLYRGRHPAAAVKVSVDITIAVQAAEQPVMITNGWYISDDTEGVVLLVPHRKGIGDQWRLSYPTLERNMILHAGVEVARVYQLLKFLAALHHARDNLKREIPRKSSLSSYALKTCLFRYMRHHFRPPPWQPEDSLRHAIGILRQFPVNSCEMTSYFNKEIVVFNVTPKSRKAVAEIISMLNQLLESQNYCSRNYFARSAVERKYLTVAV